MAVGDFYRVIHRQRYFSQVIMNVYFYRQSSGAGGANDLNTAFVLDLLTPIQSLQSDEVEHLSLETINMTDVADWDELGLGGALGAVTGDDIAPHLTLSFRLIRTTRNTRHGYKRFSGVTDAMIANGVIAPAFATAVSNLEGALENPINEPTGNEFDPYIVRLNTQGSAVIASNPVSQCVFYGITSQNTRKLGRGS